MINRKENAAEKMAARVLSSLVGPNSELNKKNFAGVKKYLKKTDFITATYKKIADVIFYLHSENKAVNIESVFFALLDNGEKPTIGHKLSLLIETMKDAPQTIDEDILTLKKISVSFRLEEATNQAREKLARGLDPYQVQRELNDATELIINDAGPKAESESFKDIDAVDDLREINNGEGPAGIPTGWDTFDYFNHGFQKGQFIIVGARPGMGKTSFMLSAIIDALLKGVKIQMFSLEMTKRKLKPILMQIISNIPKGVFYRKGAIDGDRNFLGMTEAQRLLNASNLEVYDDISEILEIKQKIQEGAKNGVELVLLDYVQLCKESSKKYGTRELEVAEISRQLKLLCNRANLCILAACQVGRPQKHVSIPPPPQLSDLRESGALEQDANAVYVIHRRSYYIKGVDFDALTLDERELAEVHCQKYRGGEMKTYKFRFIGKLTKFQEWETERPDLRDDLPYNDPEQLPPPPKDDEDLPF